jgi:molecular chaperone DnaK
VPIDRLRQLISDLQQLVAALPSAAAAAAQASATSGNGGGNGAGAASEDEEVVDAEFTRE